MSREWDRAARDRLTSTLSLGRRWRVRTELTAAIRAVSRVAEAARLMVSGRAEASGAAMTTNRTTAKTDSAPRRLIRSAVFYQTCRTMLVVNATKSAKHVLCGRKTLRTGSDGLLSEPGAGAASGPG